MSNLHIKGLTIILEFTYCLPLDTENLRNNYGIITDEIIKQSLPMFDYCLFIEKLNFVMVFRATYFWLNSLIKKGHATGKHLIYN